MSTLILGSPICVDRVLFAFHEKWSVYRDCANFKGLCSRVLAWHAWCNNFNNFRKVNKKVRNAGNWKWHSVVWLTVERSCWCGYWVHCWSWLTAQTRLVHERYRMFWKEFVGDLDSSSAPLLSLCIVLALVSHSLSSSEISLTEVMKITVLVFTRFHPNSPARPKKKYEHTDMTSTFICVI